MKSAKGAALVLAGVSAVYLVLLGQIAIALITSGDAVGTVLGASILVFPLLGAWLIWREITFGIRAQRLQEQWAAEGLPVPEPTEFDGCREKVQQDPDSWRNWFRLGLVYARCGDKRRARSAIRHADWLFRRATV